MSALGVVALLLGIGLLIILVILAELRAQRYRRRCMRLMRERERVKSLADERERLDAGYGRWQP